MKKWHKIALLLVVIIGVLVAVKSCIDKKEADITMAYIGDDFVDFPAFEIGREALAALCDDINNDGEVWIDMTEISFSDQLGQGGRQNSFQKLTSAVGMGTARVYILEEKYVISNVSSGVFADLSHLGEGFVSPDGKTVAISVEGNKTVESLGIKASEDMYIAVREVSEMDTVTDKNIQN